MSGAVEAMRLGAIDYLVKPFDLAELPLVIARARRAKQSARLDEHRRSDESRAGGGFSLAHAWPLWKSSCRKSSSRTGAWARTCRRC